jgi:hypothetical protein
MITNRVNSKTLNLFLASIVSLNLGLIALPQIALASDIANDEGLPTYRRDGGSRGEASCTMDNRNLVALAPQNNIGITASTSPQLFFYIPATSEPKTLEFVLRDQEDKLVYETTITHHGKSGLLNLAIPETVGSKLSSNSNYHWYLSLICNSEERSLDAVIQGDMKHVTINSILQQQLADANPIKRADIYQQQGIWYDALAVLAQSQQEQASPAIEKKWLELLKSVGLTEFPLESLSQ